MGWNPFSSETKTSVSAAAMQIGYAPEHPYADATMYSVYHGLDLVQTLMMSIRNGIIPKVEQYWQYGRDHYTLGMPSGTFVEHSKLDDTDVASVITIDLNLPNGVVVDYNYTCVMDSWNAIIDYLKNTRGFDGVLITKYSDLFPPSTGGWTTVNVSLTSMTTSVNGLYVNITYDRLEVRRYGVLSLSYHYISSTVTETVDISNLNLGHNYCVAVYRELNNNGSIISGYKYWKYDIDSGVYPQLSLTHKIPEHNNILPVVPLRYNNVDLTSNISTALYKTSKKLLHKIGVDFDQMATQLNANPSISQIDNAYIMFGVDLQTTNPVCIKYLVEFFDYIYEQAIHDSNSFLQNETKYSQPLKNGFFLRNAINDSLVNLKEYGLDTRIAHQEIDSGIINGVIGPIGTATKSFERINETRTVTVTDGENDIQVHRLVPVNAIVFRYQLTANAYKQVKVVGLEMTDYIHGSHRAIVDLNDIKFDPNNHNFVLPLHYGVANSMSTKDRNILYMEALQIIINSWEEYTVRWYQQGWFKGLVMFAGAILVVATGGGATGWIASLNTAIAAGTVVSWLFETALLGLSISLAVHYTVEILGIKGTFVAAVALVAVAYFTNKPLKLGTVAGKMITITAKDLLKLSFTMVTKIPGLIDENTKKIYEELGDLKSKSEAELKEITDLREKLGLDHNASVDLVTYEDSPKLVEPIRYEYPDQFYDRTIHTGNVGVISLKSTELFVEAMVQLPVGVEQINSLAMI